MVTMMFYITYTAVLDAEMILRKRGLEKNEAMKFTVEIALL